MQSSGRRTSERGHFGGVTYGTGRVWVNDAAWPLKVNVDGSFAADVRLGGGGTVVLRDNCALHERLAMSPIRTGELARRAGLGVETLRS